MKTFSIRSHAQRLAVTLLLATPLSWLAGCATPTARQQIQLDGVVVDGQRLARPDETGLLRVYRAGQWIEGRAPMVLQAGDQVVTGPNASAVIRYPSGSELFLRANTRGRIGSFTDFVGEVFARIRGVFAVETTFVKAGAEGTAYTVRSQTGGDYALVVYEGRVRLSSLSGAWPPVAVDAGRMSAGRPQVPPHVAVATPQELQRMHDWVDPIERLAPAPKATSYNLGAAAIAAAAVIGVIAASRDSDRDTPPDTSTRVVPADTQPLVAPAGTAPGTPSQRAPLQLRNCRSLALSWRPVNGARDYLVVLEAATPDEPNTWRRVGSPSSTSTRVAAGDGLTGGRIYRWNVRARDAQGRAGAASAPLYFSCGPAYR